MKFTLTHEINCSTERFWKLFFERTYNETLYRQGLQFPQFEIVSQEETDQYIKRTVKAQPKMDVPAPVAKLFGSTIAYTEDATFARSTGILTWKATPSLMADKIKNEGSMRVEAIGTDKVRRIVDLTLEVRVFGVGGMIESMVEKTLRDGWNQSVPFMNQWLSTH